MSARRLLPATLAAALALMGGAPAAWAEDGDVLELRVIGTDPVLVDRGAGDGVSVGDRVTVRPRGGGVYSGRVVEVRDRESVVTFADQGFTPEPGTAGEVRLGGEAPAGPEEGGAGAKKREPTEEERWENEDKEWEPGMPLLSGRPLRPQEREAKTTLRVFGGGAVTSTPADDFDSSFFRAGVDAVAENYFGQGERIRFLGEIDYLTEQNDETGLDLLVRRLSYVWGGTRFRPMRIEAGRFLHHGLAEFGVIDGAEWSQRLDGGHSFGFALGFLPEPDDDFDSFSDFSFSGFFRWVADPHERLVVTGGYQKTWHNGEADRDLVVLKTRYRPEGGLRVDAVAWIDFYTSGDDLKSGVGLTYALVTVGRSYADGSGYTLVYRHQEFPDILRQGEFLPPIADELDDARLDRLSLDAWRWYERTRVYGHLSVYNDEDETGGAIEVGMATRGGWDGTLFANTNEFEQLAGARLAYGRTSGNLRWDVFYEVSFHHFDGFDDDRDDLIQHRLRASGTLLTASGWDVLAYAEASVYDEEVAGTIGFSFQRRY